MSRPSTPLPLDLLDVPFRTRDALDLGVAPGRLRGRGLATPFATVRAPAGQLDAHRIATAFALRQGADQVVSHTTALALWGAPLPRRIQQQRELHVSSIGTARPRTRLTIPHLVYPERIVVTLLGDLQIVDPATSWVQSAPLLGLDDLVAAGDFLITGTEPFDDVPPLTDLMGLRRAVARNAGGRGVKRAREALELIRYGPLSRRESFLHLMFWRGRLPRAEANFTVRDAAGRAVHMLDAAHVEFQVGTEYESLLHLDPAKFRRDIRKQHELASLGWELHRLTSDDVDPRLRTPASRAALARIRTSLLARGWHPFRE